MRVQRSRAWCRSWRYILRGYPCQSLVYMGSSSDTNVDRSLERQNQDYCARTRARRMLWHGPTFPDVCFFPHTALGDPDLIPGRKKKRLIPSIPNKQRATAGQWSITGPGTAHSTFIAVEFDLRLSMRFPNQVPSTNKSHDDVRCLCAYMRTAYPT